MHYISNATFDKKKVSRFFFGQTFSLIRLSNAILKNQYDDKRPLSKIIEVRFKWTVYQSDTIALSKNRFESFELSKKER